MFELVQIIWDLFMMRKEAKAERLTWRKGLVSFGLVAFAYPIAVPAAALYQKHPEYKSLFIAAMVLAAIDFVFLIGLGLYWWKHPEAQQA